MCGAAAWALRAGRLSHFSTTTKVSSPKRVCRLPTPWASMVARRVRPTALQPLWHVAGFALGAATAMIGERAAMACTVAVEEVIDEHYGGQAERLGPEEAELKGTIETFQADEREHRDTALEHGAERTPGYEVLRGAIKSGSRLAIWLSERI